MNRPTVLPWALVQAGRILGTIIPLCVQHGLAAASVLRLGQPRPNAVEAALCIVERQDVVRLGAKAMRCSACAGGPWLRAGVAIPIGLEDLIAPAIRGAA